MVLASATCKLLVSLVTPGSCRDIKLLFAFGGLLEECTGTQRSLGAEGTARTT